MFFDISMHSKVCIYLMDHNSPEGAILAYWVISDGFFFFSNNQHAYHKNPKSQIAYFEKKNSDNPKHTMTQTTMHGQAKSFRVCEIKAGTDRYFKPVPLQHELAL